MNRLTLIEVVSQRGDHHKRARYRCACGNETTACIRKVETGHTRSCGCLRRELMRDKQTRHGHYHEPEYACWKAITARCLGKGPGAAWYRHVFVCERWLLSYAAFLEDVGRRPSPAHSIDRIDPAGDYEPANVRWADRATQARNTKNHCTNKTGVRGVSWSKSKSCWRAAIYVDNRQRHVGYFPTLEQAAAARRDAEALLWEVKERA